MNGARNSRCRLTFVILASALLSLLAGPLQAQGLPEDGVDIEDQAAPSDAPVPTESKLPGKLETFEILGVSWSPGFCETAPRKPECASQTADRFDASHFTLHGVWRLGVKTCVAAKTTSGGDRDKPWLEMPEIDISADLKAELALKMPGVASGLDRYQWQRYGICSGMTEEEFFRRALRLVDEINASPLASLFAASIGREINERQINDALVAGFGDGARGKVKMRCKSDGGRQVITGLTFGLARLPATVSLDGLLANAAPVAIGCKAGIVDAAGFQ
jgi:ribonuclease T2